VRLKIEFLQIFLISEPFTRKGKIQIHMFEEESLESHIVCASTKSNIITHLIEITGVSIFMRILIWKGGSHFS
jgi:hypothetical protein